jgi:hypothetical protein
MRQLFEKDKPLTSGSREEKNGPVSGIGFGRQRQADIYLAGVRGQKPRVPQSAAALEREAERAMSKEGFAYIAAGAGLETTMKANRPSLLDYNDAKRGLEPPAERRARQHATTALTARPHSQQTRRLSAKGRHPRGVEFEVHTCARISHRLVRRNRDASNRRPRV